MSDSQVSLESKGHSVWEKIRGTFKNLGLFAAQCNGIAVCAYSLKLLPCCMVCSIKTSFIFLFDK